MSLLDRLAKVSAAPSICALSEDTAGKPHWAHCCDGYGNAKSRSNGKVIRCGTHWRNTEAASHCSVCHLTFVSTSSFDAHRVGPYDGERRCLTVDEMGDWEILPGPMAEGVQLADLRRAPAKSEAA